MLNQQRFSKCNKSFCVRRVHVNGATAQRYCCEFILNEQTRPNHQHCIGRRGIFVFFVVQLKFQTVAHAKSEHR